MFKTFFELVNKSKSDGLVWMVFVWTLFITWLVGAPFFCEWLPMGSWSQFSSPSLDKRFSLIALINIAGYFFLGKTNLIFSSLIVNFLHFSDKIFGKILGIFYAFFCDKYKYLVSKFS